MSKNDRDWHQKQRDSLRKAKKRMRDLDEAVKTKDPRKIKEALERYDKDVGNGEK